MKWLFSYTVASIVGSFLVVRLFDYIFAETKSAVVGAAKAGLFVSTWTAITTALGMRDFSQTVKVLRRKAKGASGQQNALQKVVQKRT